MHPTFAEAVCVTPSGRRLSLIAPDPGGIDPDDLAHMLARTPRGAASPRSLAQHCCEVSDLCPEGLRAFALLHHAADAYLGYLPAATRLALRRLPWGCATPFDHLRHHLTRRACERFGVAEVPCPAFSLARPHELAEEGARARGAGGRDAWDAGRAACEWLDRLGRLCAPCAPRGA